MYITALDIGSSQIKVLIAETDKDGKVSLASAFKIPSTGLRKGEIITFEEALHVLKNTFKEIRQVNRAALKNIFVNVGGSNIKLQNSRGIVAVARADNEIYSEDVERAIKASQAINLGPNRLIVHTITKEFIVDGINDIIDPLGMVGNRLEVNSLIIDAFKPTVNNLIKAIEVVGGKIGGLIYNPLASARSVLTKNQKELGVAIIDIGFGTTSMAVYEEDKLVSAAVFPIGSSNITNDLAIGLRCPIKTAEAIKISCGAARAKEISTREKIELHQIDETLNSVINRRFISEIIEIRLAEIFDLVNNELKALGKSGQLPAGAVITGGGAKMNGILELAKQELKLSVQIGVPGLLETRSISDELKNQIEEPDFAASAGLLLMGFEQAAKEIGWLPNKKGWFRKILGHFLP